MSATKAQTLRFTRRFAAPRERVFRAWTNAQELKEWWRPNGFTTGSVEIDLREGGRYSIAMQPPRGEVRYVRGTYVEVRPPERLVMTWSTKGSPRHDGPESLLTIEFIADGAATEVILTHEHLPGIFVSDHSAGWRSTLDHLSDYLQRDSRP
jgi:uncharacterized protein YndB with AHSA1/START domain